MPDVGCQYSSSTTLPVVIERSQETFSTSLWSCQNVVVFLHHETTSVTECVLAYLLRE
jgi:hypothetical protein